MSLRRSRGRYGILKIRTGWKKLKDTRKHVWMHGWVDISGVLILYLPLMNERVLDLLRLFRP